MQPSVFMGEGTVIVCRDPAELHHRAAVLFLQLANQRATGSGRFTVALSGGSTPKALYSLLATPGFADRIPWSKVHLFWGDERCVPPDHADSNYKMVRESLLSEINLAPENVHRMAGEKEPKLAAAEYEEQLIRFFRLAKGEPPRFDLVLLGLGDDGHTASLFPDSEALKESERLVAVNFVDKLNAHRLTLTLPVLNQGEEIIFLVAGESKAAIVKRLFGANAEAVNLPAARVRPVHGHLSWFIARDAAAEQPAQ